jgi:hypothetical protein
MLIDSTAYLYLFELFKEKYDFGGILYNMSPKLYKRQNRRPHNHLVCHAMILFGIQHAQQ